MELTRDHQEPLTAGLTTRPDDILSKSLELLAATEQLEHWLLYGYSTLLVVGSPFGGKTSLIERFAAMVNHEKPPPQTAAGDSSATYQETISLEYRFLRKDADLRTSEAETTLGSKVANIWELGSGTLFTGLLRFALDQHTITNSAVVLVLDLTRPTEMAVLSCSLLEKIRQHIEAIGKAKPKLKRHLLEQTKARMRKGATSADAVDSTTTHFPVPLLILGTKYDQFQNLDPEVKKQVVRYLRTIACHHGASMLFTSTRSETLMKRTYQALDSLAFGGGSSSIANLDDSESSSSSGNNKPTVSTNFSKPVSLPFGYDTLARIGVTSWTQVDAEFRSNFSQIDLQQLYVSSLGADPRTDVNFSEPEIDKVLEYKYMLLNSA